MNWGPRELNSSSPWKLYFNPGVCSEWVLQNPDGRFSRLCVIWSIDSRVSYDSVVNHRDRHAKFSLCRLSIGVIMPYIDT